MERELYISWDAVWAQSCCWCWCCRYTYSSVHALNSTSAWWWLPAKQAGSVDEQRVKHWRRGRDSPSSLSAFTWTKTLRNILGNSEGGFFFLAICNQVLHSASHRPNCLQEWEKEKRKEQNRGEVKCLESEQSWLLNIAELAGSQSGVVSTSSSL